MVWTKAPADLVRCSTQSAAATPAPAPDASSTPAPATGGGAQQAAPAEQAKPETNDGPTVAENEKEGVDIEGIAGDVFTRKDGKCKVDTPWVKLDFDCEGKEEEPGQKK